MNKSDDSKQLEIEYEYFKANLDEWMKDHEDQWVVIKDQKDYGFFETFQEARAHVISVFGLEQVAIQEITKTPVVITRLLTGIPVTRFPASGVFKKNLTVIIKQCKSGRFIGKIPSIPGCFTQANTEEELYERLNEAASLCYAAMKPKEREDFEASRVVEITFKPEDCKIYKE